MGAVEVRALVGGGTVAHLPGPAAGKTRYMMLVCTDPAVEPQELARVEPVEPWVTEMSSRGVRLFGSELEPAGSARTVRGKDTRRDRDRRPVRGDEGAGRRLRRA